LTLAPLLGLSVNKVSFLKTFSPFEA
jgi:hypothetical protein